MDMETDKAHVTRIDEYKSIRTHWVYLYLNNDNPTNLDSLGNLYISKELNLNKAGFFDGGFYSGGTRQFEVNPLFILQK